MMNAWQTTTATTMVIAAIAFTAAAPGCTSSNNGVPCQLAQHGDPCETLGEKCGMLDDCGGTLTECSDHTWKLVFYDEVCCFATACPPDMPAAGGPCDPCSADCDYPCDSGSAQATCVGGQWEIAMHDCSRPPELPCLEYGTMEACQADTTCRWLTPASCSDGPLVQIGCYPAGECTPDRCPASLTCTLVDYDPCYLAACSACSASTWVCQ